MKKIFQTIFGSLTAVACGIAIAWGGSQVWHAVFPHGTGLFGSNVAGSAAAAPATSGALPSGSTDQPVGASYVSGMKRVIRYTADEEEDLINQAALSLPAGSDSKISADAYLVEDLKTGAIAAEYDQERLLPIASLSKLVTAVVARRLIPASTEITITPAIMSTYGNTASFTAGETFTAGDLLYPLLMVSSNDAAEAYAQSYGRAKFLAAMNEFTQSIGAYRTTFKDPSGLSPQNESTAEDLATIVNWIRAHDPEIMNVTELKTKSVRGHFFVNPTHFLSWSYYLGGKNGYTDEADRTAIALFALGANKDPYIVVVLGSSNRDADVIRLLAKVKY